MKYIVIVSILIFAFQNAIAQLSPGDLSQVHADLEGISNCTKCHEIGQKIKSSKCLSCHKVLDKRIQDGKGLHANSGFENCADCHSEHHGREFKMVFWENGQDNFDHKQTGFELFGKHGSVKCNDCHNRQFIKNKKELQSNKKDLNKTFLGLSRECLSCHQDEHRGQMDNNCLNCHNLQNWKPAPKFNHNNTKFPLTGLHKNVECKNCHQSITDNKYKNNAAYLKFAGLQHQSCLDCHKDPHNKKFGKNCHNCHNTSGWQNYAKNRFNHNKTEYHLNGKHSFVPCEKCHGKNRSKINLKYENCTDCHNDYHAGQFVKRKQKGACEECHTVSGFTPANFTIKEHNNTGFSLKGAHLAIPCIACHTETKVKNVKTLKFKFSSFNCVGCHNDPHRGQVNKFLTKTSLLTNKTGCEFCHNSESWKSVQFDHSQTRFKLVGVHNKILCNECHKKENDTFIKFELSSTECADCHIDIHMGQFNGDTNKTDCSRCHTPVDWYAEKFNHEAHSTFSLKGAHSQVPCQQCHKTENVSGTTIVRYKPLNSDCKTCHGDSNKLHKGIQ